VGRREELADAGVRLTAGGGVRALTHRAVDVEAGRPPGSTSYYARTRRELTALVVERITAQLSVELSDLQVPERLDDDAVVVIAAAFLDQLAARRDAQAARLALLLELRNDEVLRAPLTAADPVRAGLNQAAQALLGAIGVTDAVSAAVDLVGLIDALLLYRTADVAPLNHASVLTAFIAGLPRR
jgi:DNA-binding transcriptional regulator YbjK